MYSTIAWWCWLLAFVSTGTDAARILMTSPQVTSHILTQLSIGSELTKLGHEVHIALANRFPKPEMVTKRGIGIIYYQYPLDALYPISEEAERKLIEPLFDPTNDWLSGLAVLRKNYYDGCWYMMSDEAFLDRVKQMNFDLILVEPFILCPCTMILPYHLHLPFVSVTTSYFPWYLGLPALPSSFALVSPTEAVGYPELDSFVGRLKSTVAYAFRALVLIPKIFWSNTTLLHHYKTADRPVTSWLDLMRQSQLFIFDRDYHLEEFPYPLLPNVVAVPGLNTNPADPLSPDLEEIFVASGDNHVILVTFGASASFIPAHIVKKFFDAFSRLQQTVVAKFDVPDDVAVPPNVKLLKWLPQNDILGHPKTILFITHCGGNGQYEAVYHGVPMLGMPLYAEQSWNSERAVRKGFGLELDIKSFTADQLYETIVRLIPENSTYRVAVKKMSAIMKSYPKNGRQTAAYWIDHVIKFGGKHLRPLSIDQPLYQFLMLDILLFVFVVAAVLGSSCVCCMRFACRRLLRNGRSESSSQSKKKQ